ncbi:murein hydrolase activator EnvC family protein [Cellulomonas sp. S1-8]|uniref:murein hydrolase activator EnvC family protein n=1 Tax=Cellulomonas sp. S1-8 TaxID=2904790 RepID=UPI002244397B|nr:M23 family metallopeptidase [Cellulomonas sp. S1-8]UZN04841.1 M23 family metallopeptidase [Cellulomonas sp. S1-8]
MDILPRDATARRVRLRVVLMTALVLAASSSSASADEGSAGTPPAHGAAVAVDYRPPLDAPVMVLRAFDPPPQPWLAGHRGVDLAASAGARVRAPAAGVVTFAGPVAGRGVVTVLHDDGLRSSLEPVRPSRTVGTRVGAGDEVGTLSGDAHGGVPGGPALHWGVRTDDRYVDPWALLPGRGPVVLLPVP